MAQIKNTGRVAIVTKYLGVTDHRNSRIRVWRADSTYSGDPQAITVDWDHDLDVRENHDSAVAAYLQGTDWGGVWITGGSQTGCVAVWLSEDGDN